MGSSSSKSRDAQADIGAIDRYPWMIEYPEAGKCAAGHDSHQTWCCDYVLRYDSHRHLHPMLESTRLIPGETIRRPLADRALNSLNYLMDGIGYHYGIYAGLCNGRPVVVHKVPAGILVEYMRCDEWVGTQRLQLGDGYKTPFAYWYTLKIALIRVCKQQSDSESEKYTKLTSNCHHFVLDCINGNNIARGYMVSNIIAVNLSFDLHAFN